MNKASEVASCAKAPAMVGGGGEAGELEPLDDVTGDGVGSVFQSNRKTLGLRALRLVVYVLLEPFAHRCGVIGHFKPNSVLTRKHFLFLQV